MSDKSKRKNSSPEELLQQAKLLHPENGAFIRGETKNLPHKAELLANLYSQAGFTISDKNLQATRRNRLQEFSFILIGFTFPCSCAGLIVITSYVHAFVTQYKPSLLLNGLIILPFALLFAYIGIGSIGNLWRIATTSEQKIQARIVNSIKNGKFIMGKATEQGEGRFVIAGRSGSYSESKSFDLSYISPDTGKLHRISWHSLQYRTINIDDDIILLYLNNNCVIVL
jgi:hypothetical protein